MRSRSESTPPCERYSVLSLSSHGSKDGEIVVGCSDDRDLTYFGEAFYRDALPAASDLKAAFKKASADIAARERAEGRTASNPQAHFGHALVTHLKTAFPGT